MAPVVLKISKILKNPLLSRLQLKIDVIHPERANVPREELTKLIAQRFKTDVGKVVLFGFRTTFGGGRSTGFGLIYDSLEYLLKYEPNHRLQRAKIIQPKEASRKNNKEIKRKVKRSRGKERVKHLKNYKGIPQSAFNKKKAEFLKSQGK